jgi:hypothetical protein
MDNEWSALLELEVLNKPVTPTHCDQLRTPGTASVDFSNAELGRKRHRSRI